MAHESWHAIRGFHIIVDYYRYGPNGAALMTDLQTAVSNPLYFVWNRLDLRGPTRCEV
jgi:hypothetical protein